MWYLSNQKNLLNIDYWTFQTCHKIDDRSNFLPRNTAPKYCEMSVKCHNFNICKFWNDSKSTWIIENLKYIGTHLILRFTFTSNGFFFHTSFWNVASSSLSLGIVKFNDYWPWASVLVNFCRTNTWTTEFWLKHLLFSQLLFSSKFLSFDNHWQLEMIVYFSNARLKISPARMKSMLAYVNCALGKVGETEM